MRRHTAPWLVAAFLLSASSASASEVSDLDRFELWAGCAPVAELVDDVDGDAEQLALDRSDVVTAVRSRLRSARIFDDAADTWLFVNITVSGPAFSVDVEFMRDVEVLWNKPDGTKLYSGLVGFTATWMAGSTGTHGNDPSYILWSVAHQIDKFIDEYLRVNADACQ